MTSSLDSVAYADLQALAQLRSQVRAEGDDRSPETLRKVAGQFEALFVQMMLKNMRDSSLNEGLLDSDQTKFYQGMFDQQIATEMTKGQGLGLADMLIRQLGGDTTAASGAAAPRMADPFAGPVAPPRRGAVGSDAGRPPASHMLEPVASNADNVRRQWRPENREEFVSELWPYAEQAGRQLGIDPGVLIAQAALETGWGRQVMQRGDGASSHNLFGIKADSRWSGEQVSSRTMEFRDGFLQREQAVFRAYGSPAQSIADYADFISGNPRYRDAIGSRDPGRYAAELQRAGYATDPAYAQKIMSIFNSDQFQQAVAQAQSQIQRAATEAQETSVVNQQPVNPIDNAPIRAGKV